MRRVRSTEEAIVDREAVSLTFLLEECTTTISAELERPAKLA
jgi:hypothetical protein